LNNNTAAYDNRDSGGQNISSQQYNSDNTSNKRDSDDIGVGDSSIGSGEGKGGN